MQTSSIIYLYAFSSIEPLGRPCSVLVYNFYEDAAALIDLADVQRVLIVIMGHPWQHMSLGLKVC